MKKAKFIELLRPTKRLSNQLAYHSSEDIAAKINEVIEYLNKKEAENVTNNTNK